ncbi:hypothetical protein NFHSH190041_07390 [Shewanella sp. NFH-SH190041]|uniref:DUF3581 domain-containing protein n=1 Tax=Shewanella sp. NFH-SH190041 TaxID=2950245 RepID=UPI0021C46E98|nr:DUF3581 domain-containing protein [Shewanella sp. NFH-SH190041]BDM63287.1 hypothetical protein NFHSH190041_07390 [Shewanella sp. NFH-SH190041]
MFLQPYFNESCQGVEITPAQASAFAKGVAGDFNPIHDVDAKRFCVPGDLLFALIMGRYGLRQQMQFSFSGMVGAGVTLQLPQAADEMQICDSRDKPYLSVCQSGDVSHNRAQIESFIRSYVAFSGLNFTHVLVPLMKAHQVMINPERPLVIYESMSFTLSELDFTEVKLELVSKTLMADGKRGDVTLEFALISDGRQVGTGQKKLVLSGLRPYEETAVQQLCDAYLARSMAMSA